MAESSSWADQIDAEDAQAASALPISTVNQGAAAVDSSIGPANQALLDGAAEARVLADLPDTEVAAPADGWARTRDGRLARPSANTHHRLGVRAGQDRRDPAMASRSGSREARPWEEAQERPRFPAFIAPAPNAGDAAMTVPSPLISIRRCYVLRHAMSPEAKALQDRRRKNYDTPRNLVVFKLSRMSQMLSSGCVHTWTRLCQRSSRPSSLMTKTSTRSPRRSATRFRRIFQPLCAQRSRTSVCCQSRRAIQSCGHSRRCSSTT